MYQSRTNPTKKFDLKYLIYTEQNIIRNHWKDGVGLELLGYFQGLNNSLIIESFIYEDFTDAEITKLVNEFNEEIDKAKNKP